MKDDRRRYFRIEDQVILAWHVLTPHEKAKGLERFERGEIQYPDRAGLFLAMEADLIDIMQNINAKQPELAKALELLNRKINLFARAMPMNDSVDTLLDGKPQTVSISASGLSFTTKETAEPGQDIQLEIVLLPGKLYILCYATVVDCNPLSAAEMAENTPHQYRLNVDFSTIRDEDVERLVQHIMRKEVEFLRARRKSRQSD